MDKDEPVSKKQLERDIYYAIKTLNGDNVETSENAEWLSDRVNKYIKVALINELDQLLISKPHDVVASVNVPDYKAIFERITRRIVEIQAKYETL